MILPTLTGTGAGATKAASKVTDWETNGNLETVTKDFPSHWGNADVRGALYAMHGYACVYCQRELTGSDRGDVEHFRPKSWYWWLAYDFKNYLLSCTPCNRYYKKEKFPLKEGTKRVGFDEKDGIDLEERCLLDPVTDPVKNWIRVNFKALSKNPKEVRKKGLPVSIADEIAKHSFRYEQCQETIAFFKLNIDPVLMKERAEIVLKVQTMLKLMAFKEAENLVKPDLRRMASRYEPHSYIVRDILTLRDASLIPTPLEELEWLIKEFLGDLSRAKDGTEKYPDENKPKEDKEKACWALAVLWKDPPVASPEQVKAWIRAEELLEEIQPYYDKLSTGAPVAAKSDD